MPAVDPWPSTAPTRIDTLADVLESLRAEIDAEMEVAVAKDEAAEAKSREELARELLEALRREVEENRSKGKGGK